MIALLAAWSCLAAPAEDDPFTVRLAFEKMHCAECRAEIEATLKKIDGCRTVETAGNVVTATFDDTKPIPTFQKLPRDLKLKKTTLTLYGTVSVSDDKVLLTARGSGAVLTLQNSREPGAPDKVGELRKRRGGKNRVLIDGEPAGARNLTLESFAVADWKDR